MYIEAHMNSEETAKKIFSKPLSTLSLRERSESLWIMKLRRIPQFPEIVRRLLKGETVWGVAGWLMSCPDRGELSGCSFETLRKYLTCLAIRVRENAERTPRFNLGDMEKAAVHAHLEAKMRAAVKDLPDPAGFDDLRKIVTEETEKLDALAILKYCFVIQRERVKELRELERKAKMPLPHGNKTVQVLALIAAEIRKIEVGDECLKKIGSQSGAMSPGRLVPHESQLMPVVQEVATLPEVEQNLIRDASSKVLDLIQQEAKVGPYASRVPDEHGAAKTPKGSGN